MPALDDRALDPDLARTLHRAGVAELDTLRALLDDARRQQVSLARLVVERELLTEAEVTGHLADARRTSTAAARRVAIPPAAVERAPPPDELQEQPTRLMAEPPLPLPADEAAPTPTAPAEQWRVGATVGGYRLLERLGAGAMGVVFLGERVEGGERHALKTLRDAPDKDERDRFRREGEALLRADSHPNVARVIGLGDGGGRPFIAMEPCLAGSLERRLRQGPLPIEEAVAVVAAIARGLAHMHARGVVHRDLKPSNVLFGDGGVPKLVDFGLARVDGARALTRTGDVLGTPSYMAPEQALGERDRIGPWTDLFALGGVAHACLTGRPAFAAESHVATLKAVLRAETPRPSTLRPEVPRWLDAIVLAMLVREPEGRPTAADVARALAAGDRAGAARRVPLALAGLALLVAAWAAVDRLGRPRPADPVDVSAAAPPAPERPPTRPTGTAPQDGATVWGWPAGEARSYTLALRSRSDTGPRGATEEAARRWSLRLTARAAAPRRLELRGRVDGLTALGGPPGAPTLDFDARRPDASTSPLAAAVGLELELALDPATGAALEAPDVAAVQSAILGRLGKLQEGGRARLDERSFQLPELTGPGLVEVLSALTALRPEPGPPGQRPAAWSVRREVPLANRLAGGLALDCPVRVATGPDGVEELTYAGTATGVLRGDRPLTRTARGEARLRRGTLERARYEERWTGAWSLEFSYDLGREP